MLAKMINDDETLHQMLLNQYAIVVINSSTYTSLTNKIQEIISKKVRLLYMSQTKIQAFQDCITFMPQLFRLSKSIIVTENVQTFQERYQKKSNVVEKFDHKRELSHYSDDNNPSIVNMNTVDQFFKTYKSQLKFQNQETQQKFDSKDQITNLVRRCFRQISHIQLHDLDKDQALKVFQLVTQALITQYPELEQDDFARAWDSIDLNRRGTVNRLQIENFFQHKVEMMKKQPTEIYDYRHTQKNIFETNERRFDSKQQKLMQSAFKVIYNFGTTIDFLNYSGMSIQGCLQRADLQKPTQPAGVRGGNVSLYHYQQSQPCNMFAIAKIGVPNLVLPNTMDVKFSNYENYDSYTEIADLFFPGLGHNQIAVAIFRPQVVRSGLNHLLVEILKANQFTFLKRTTRALTKDEAGYLMIVEKIEKTKQATYMDTMMDGPCEIFALSKIGAIGDLKTLFNGANPFGRRQKSIADDQDTQKLDSQSSMFQISPFSSFNEIIDLHDYVVRNSVLNKYKAQASQSIKTHVYQELEFFQRFFNLVGCCSDSTQAAEKELQVFFPKLAKIEDVVLVLNPKYEPIFEQVQELIVRLGFKFIKSKSLKPDQWMLQVLFEHKLKHHSAQERKLFYETLKSNDLTFLHICKIAGKKEIKRLYQQCQVQLDNLMVAKQFGFPLKLDRITQTCIYLDTESSYEQGLELIYKPSLLQLQGRDLVKKFSKSELYTIIQTNLLITVGDTLKVLQFDQTSGLFKDKNPLKSAIDNFSSLNIVHQVDDAQFWAQLNATDLNSLKYAYQSYKVETQKSGVMCLRFKNYQFWDRPSKLEHNYQSLLLYYQQVNKYLFNVCPNIYRYKIARNSRNEIKRAVEVEEFMGENFIDVISDMNTTHSSGDRYESIPAYVYSKKLAEMCQQLVNMPVPESMSGVGKIQYDQNTHRFVGECEPKDYYSNEIKKYYGFLERFKMGWHHFLSILDIDLIEQKTNQILQSTTFKHTRNPNSVRLAPERITSNELRISEKVHRLNQDSLNLDNFEKFFSHLQQQVVDRNKDNQIYENVDSVLQTIRILGEINKPKIEPNFTTGVYPKQSQKENQMAQIQQELQKELMVYRNVAIAGFQDGICVRTQYHLLANLLWIFNFELKKCSRRKDLFTGKDKDYDSILEQLQEQLIKHYFGKNPIAVDVINLQGDQQTDFDRAMRLKQQHEEKKKKELQIEQEWEKRKQRAVMTIDQLIQSEIHYKADQERLKEKQTLIKDLKLQRGDPQGEAFKKKLDDAGIMLGPFASKIAEQDVIRMNAVQQQQKNNFAHEGQENISIPMMEYFLFGMAEANRIVDQLQTMEKIQTKWSESIENFEQEKAKLENLRNQSQGEARVRCQDTIYKIKEKIQEFSVVYEDLIGKINILQSDLVLVFKELALCNTSVHKNYFDEWRDQQLVNQYSDTFQVTVKTYWLPTAVPGDAEPVYDLTNETWKKIVGAWNLLHPLQTGQGTPFGRFLSQTQRDYLVYCDKHQLDKSDHEICRECKAKFIKLLPSGRVDLQLRKPDDEQKPKLISHEKYWSTAQLEQAWDFLRVSRTLKEKNSKVKFQPNQVILERE